MTKTNIKLMITLRLINPKYIDKEFTLKYLKYSLPALTAQHNMAAGRNPHLENNSKF